MFVSKFHPCTLQRSAQRRFLRSISLADQALVQCADRPNGPHRVNCFSSVAATSSSSVEEDSEEFKSEDSNFRTTTASKPRLNALRRRLELEGQSRSVWVEQTKKPKSIDSMNSDQNFVQQQPTIPSGKGCSSSPSSSSSLAYQVDEESLDRDVAALEELIHHIESLPDVGTSQEHQHKRVANQHPLTDRFGRKHSYLRISLSERCNLRCLYCMPEQGVPLQPPSHLLSNEEIIRLTGWFVEQGVTKIRLTGGEPLLRKDIIPLIGEINTKYGSSLDQIGMTTNGVSLSKRKLQDLISAGLTHVNLSLDSLNAETFATLTRRPVSFHAKVLRALEDCATLLPYHTKVNVVVMPSNVHEMIDFVRLTLDMPIDVRFIEYMPFNDNQWTTSEGFVSYQQMIQRLQDDLMSTREQRPGYNSHNSDRDLVLTRLRDGPNDTTKWWGLTSSAVKMQNSDSIKALGRVGFITSMSEHFCSTCNRLRLTADGKLKVCLFGRTEVSLRDLLRRGKSCGEEDHDETLLQKVIHYAVQQKHYKLGGHADMYDLSNHSAENRPMTLIGG